MWHLFKRKIRGAREYFKNISTVPEQGKNVHCLDYWKKTGMAGKKSMGKEEGMDQIMQILKIGF